MDLLLKVAFYQKVRFVFQISKSPKKIFQKTILNLKFKTPTHNIILLLVEILYFKFRLVFWNIFLGRMGDLKKESHFLKKNPLFMAKTRQKSKVIEIELKNLGNWLIILCMEIFWFFEVILRNATLQRVCGHICAKVTHSTTQRS